MNIRFRARLKYGDSTIESEKIITFEKAYYLYYKYNTSISSYGSMWIEIDPSTLEIIKEV